MSYRNRAIHSLTIDDFCGASFIRADVHIYEIVSKREARIKFLSRKQDITSDIIRI